VIDSCECGTINCLRVVAGENSFKTFGYNDWFYHYTEELLVRPITKKLLDLFGNGKIVTFKNFRSNLNPKVLVSSTFIYIIFFVFPTYLILNVLPLPFFKFTLELTLVFSFILFCIFLVFQKFLRISRIKMVCGFAFSWLTISSWTSWLVDIVGYPILLISLYNLILNPLLLPLLKEDTSFFCSILSILLIFMLIPWLLWCRLFIENLIKIYGEKERILGEKIIEVYGQNLTLQPFVALVLFVVIALIYFYLGSRIADITTLLIVFVYFIPLFPFFIAVFQHLITLPYLCYLEWGYRSGEMGLHKYNDLFTIEFFNKIVEVAIYVSVIATTTFLVFTDVLKIVYYTSESFRVVLDGSFNKLLLALESGINLKLSKILDWKYIRLTLFGLFILLPSSLVFFAISSTVRNIKFAQLREIQKELQLNEGNDNKKENSKITRF